MHLAVVQVVAYPIQNVIREAGSLLLQRRTYLWAIAVGLVIVMGVQPQAALAGRYVLNQSPATIEQSFGRYWTKLTQTNANGEKSVTYTYSPAPLKRFFPDRPFATLTMTYVNNRVRSVTMKPYQTAQAKRDDFIKADSAATYRIMEAKLFEAIFGYRPSINKPLYLNYGSFYSYIDCLGDGVASSYSIHLGERLDGGITLTHNPACEPPYDRIKYTEEKGPSGG